MEADIMKIIIWTNGDPSVGDMGNSTEIELSTEIDKDDKEILEHYRNEFKKIFIDLWCYKVNVLYDFEYEEMIKQEDGFYF